jgi:catechol 2,3-dioxygenase-like lactoylglutathione lyase family enzyme
MRIEHIGIYARDTRALADWYRNRLGFHVIRTLEKEGRPPIYFLAAEEGGEIEILPTDEERSDRALTAPGLSHIGLVVDDFEAIERRLEAGGLQLHGVRDTSNGWRIGYFEDPEENTLEIVYRPRGPVDRS